MKKLTYQEVKDYIESFGYLLLSDSYVNNSVKLDVLCDKGHEYKVTFGNFKQGKRCPYCCGHIRYTYNDVKTYIENAGYSLLSNIYVNNRTKLKIRCDKGHIYEADFNHYKSDQRCPICFGHPKHKYKDVKSYIESFGFKLLSNTYVNNRTKLDIQCDKGHEYRIGFNHFKKDHRCQVCLNEKRFEYQKAFIKSFGYQLMSDIYINSYNKIPIKCPVGHEYKTKFMNFKYGCRCPICVNNQTSSKPEKEMGQYVSEIYDGKILFNDRYTIVNPISNVCLELDIYLPDKRKAIEFNSMY